MEARNSGTSYKYQKEKIPLDQEQRLSHSDNEVNQYYKKCQGKFFRLKENDNEGKIRSWERNSVRSGESMGKNKRPLFLSLKYIQ